MIKDQLTSSVAGIILSHVRRERGRLTAVSDMCGINRMEFTRKGLSRMRMHRFLRVVYALALLLDYKELCGMTSKHSIASEVL